MRLFLGQIEDFVLDVVMNHALVCVAYLRFPDTSTRKKKSVRY